MVSRDAVEKAVAELVRPLVVADGGTIDVVDVKGDEVTVRLGGACSGCPGTQLTTSRIVEPVLRQATGAPIRVKLDHGR
jgi:Fe-S cluster biogenesis protein NfuA